MSQVERDVSGLQEGAVFGGWRITTIQREGSTPRYTVVSEKSGAEGTLTFFPFQGELAARHTVLAERVDKWKGIKHEQLVRVDAGRSNQGLYVVLPQQLERAGDSPLSPGEAFTALEQLAKGLSAFHQKGLVHGELDPWSVVKQGGGWRILPSGLRHGPAELVSLGIHVDPRYASPEVLDGRQPTPASDMFSLGLVLYRLLTTKAPIPSSDPIAALVSRGMSKLPDMTQARNDLPDTIVALFRWLCAPEPDLRPQNAQELLRALPAARKKAVPSPARVVPEIKPVRVAPTLGLCLLLLATLAGGYYHLTTAWQVTSPTEGFVFPDPAARE